MNLSDSIGGYFELETNDFGSVFHDDVVAVNSGRNALEFILRSSNIERINLPFYSCEVLLQPLQKTGVEYKFYNIDKEFNPIVNSIEQNEAILYVNYFGILGEKVKKLSEQYSKIIVDNTQAFFAEYLKGTYSFYSPRKFFGVPDGGFAYINKEFDDIFEVDKSYERFSHLIKCIDNGPEDGYQDFKMNDEKLNNLPLKKMSKLTTKLLRSVDFDKVKNIRNKNFMFLHDNLKNSNELTSIIKSKEINGPMVYPYLNKGNDKLRNILIKNRIYVAKYWPNVSKWVKDDNANEIYLLNNLIPLPIDQRYSIEEMKSILYVILGEFL